MEVGALPRAPLPPLRIILIVIRPSLRRCAAWDTCWCLAGAVTDPPRRLRCRLPLTAPRREHDEPVLVAREDSGRQMAGPARRCRGVYARVERPGDAAQARSAAGIGDQIAALDGTFCAPLPASTHHSWPLCLTSPWNAVAWRLAWGQAKARRHHGAAALCHVVVRR